MITVNQPIAINTVISRNPVFKRTASSRARYVVEVGSAGSGKSTEIAIRMIKKLSLRQGFNLLCVRKVGESNRDSTFAELKKVIYKMYGTNDNPMIANDFWQIPEGRSGALYLRNKLNGNEVIFRGCNNAADIQKIKSVTFENGNLTDIWIEEASEITENDFAILNDRLRGKLDAGLFYQIHLSLNPVNCWVKKRFFDYPDAQAVTNHSTYLQNRFCDADFMRTMQERAKRDPEGYRIYGLGEWGSLGGLILSNYVIKPFDASAFDIRYYGQDFGFNHKNALLDVACKEDDLYICRELVCREKDTAEIIQLADAENWRKDIEMWCDSAEPDRIKMWIKAGYRARAVSKEPNSVKGQIEYLKGVMGKDKTVPRTIYINPSCVNTIEEIKQWRWKLDRALNEYIDEPMDFNDDCMAALRYAIERNRKPQRAGTITVRLS